MSPLNWTISMDLFSLLYGERPKLNQHWVLGKKTSRRRRPWLRSETGKNKIYRSKTVQTVSAEGHPKSAEELRLFDFFLKNNYTAIGNHRRTGRGGEGGCSPPQILGNSDFLGSWRKFGQSQFLKTSPCFYYYFEEINIFYFNLKLA